VRPAIGRQIANLYAGDPSAWAHDFLRDPSDFPRGVDPNYLENQRSAGLLFLQWFRKRSSISYDEMLRAMHRIAACGADGKHYYRIPTPLGEFMSPRSGSTETHIFYDDPVSGCVRHTYPGRLRADLEAMAVAHPAIDIIDMTESDLSNLRRAGADLMGGKEEIHNCAAREIADSATLSGGVFYDDDRSEPDKSAWKQGCESHFGFTFFEVKLRASVCRRNSRRFVRRAPRGKERELLMASCAALLQECRRFYFKDDMPRMMGALLAYYHTSINTMPFANINNSLFMCQVNVLLRLMNMPTLPHGKLDQYALICSYKPFVNMVGILHPFTRAITQPATPEAVALTAAN
jgi:hypothetical protein